MTKQTTLFAIIALTLLAASSAFAQGGCEPSGDVWAIGAGPSASLIVFGNGSEPSTIAAGGGTIYTCSCENGNGTCHPTWDGKEANCASMTCSDCKLHATSAVAGSFNFSDAMVVPFQHSGGFTPDEDHALEERLDQIADFMAAQQIPVPEVIGDEAIAPEGHFLVVEYVGGRGVAYPVPAEMLNEGDGSQAIVAGGKAKCKCGGSSGSCIWQGIVCIPSASDPCNGSCQIHVKGATGSLFAAPFSSPET